MNLGSNPRVEEVYDTNSRLVYVGMAPRGSLITDQAWVIRKIIYNDAGDPYDFVTSPIDSKMSNYASLTYA